MTYPDDVLRAARDAAAEVADRLGKHGYRARYELGQFDNSIEVRAACIAIMAEREKVAALVEAAMEACRIAMEQMVAARIPECGKFGEIAQHLDAALAAFGKGEE